MTWLVLRRRDGHYWGGLWDIPGGTIEPGESPEGAAIRECAEESGMATRIGEEIAHHENQDTEGRPITFHTITYILESVPGVRTSG